MDALRIAGIVLISAAIFTGGLITAHMQGEPLKYAKAFAALITRLRGYIEFDRGELATLYTLCGGGDTAPLESAGFLADASELGWDAAVEKLCGRVYIDDDTRAALAEFGGILGKTGVDEQLRNCDRAVSRLNAIIDARAPEAAKKAKLWRTLGASGALTIAVILI